MRRATLFVCLFTRVACAQGLVPAGELAAIQRLFQPHPGDNSLPCEFTPVQPSLNFAFRFQAGYSFQVPQNLYQGATRGWSVLTAITPDGGRPVYLLARNRLSEVVRIGSSFDIGGSYFLGPGHYSMESTLRDDRNRTCRKHWQVDVGMAHAERKVPVALAPNSVRPFTGIVSPDPDLQGSDSSGRVSILLNIAALSSLRTNIRPNDRLVLLGILTSLLEHLRAASTRVVLFSLEQQQEVFRSDHFHAAEERRLTEAVAALQPSMVDVSILKKPLGHVDFLASLLARERTDPDPPDTIVFVGPISRYGGKLPENVLAGPMDTRFFYVRYESIRRPASNIPGAMTADAAGAGGPSAGSSSSEESTGQIAPAPRISSSTGGTGGGGGGGGGRRGGRAADEADLSRVPEARSDIISAAVSRLKGKTLTIHTPADLANAIRKIDDKH
jgi:hypothetical protein